MIFKCRFSFGLRAKYAMLMVLAGLLLSANLAVASEGDVRAIDFSSTTGYGLETGRVTVDGIRVDFESWDPFDPAHPPIISSKFNIPFQFNPSTYNLEPDLVNAVAVGPANACAELDVYVSDAYTGEPLAGAFVASGRSYSYTDGNGYAHLSNLPNGSAQLSSNVYQHVPITRSVALTCGDEVNSIGLALSPDSGPGSFSGNEVRVVLTWGEEPRDLDSHLTGPNANSSGPTDDVNRFHIYYASKNTDVAVLDVDDVTSFGPETITITTPAGIETLRPGLYRYSIHHYAGELNISTSNASITLQVGTGETWTFAPPAGASAVNDVWTVFELLVDSQGVMTVYPINTFSSASASAVRSTTTGYGSVETGVDFTRLPGK